MGGFKFVKKGRLPIMEDLDIMKMEHWIAFARVLEFLINKKFSWSVNPYHKRLNVYVNE